MLVHEGETLAKYWIDGERIKVIYHPVMRRGIAISEESEVRRRGRIKDNYLDILINGECVARHNSSVVTEEMLPHIREYCYEAKQNRYDSDTLLQGIQCQINNFDCLSQILEDDTLSV